MCKCIKHIHMHMCAPYACVCVCNADKQLISNVYSYNSNVIIPMSIMVCTKSVCTYIETVKNKWCMYIVQFGHNYSLFLSHCVTYLAHLSDRYLQLS